ncbi:Helicase ATP-binding domain-containing protein [Plasmodiophora brassicae]
MPVYSLRGIDIEFPFDAYPCQVRYMESVVEALQKGQNALLESPTGSGKTLCLLCASLAWRSSLPSNWKPPGSTAPDRPAAGPPLIIFASRTHSQIQQAVKQLKMTNYSPRVTVVASRDSLCVHPVSKKSSGMKLNQECSAMNVQRKCYLKNNLDEFQRINPQLLGDVYDIEDLAYIGTEHAICPYYLALDNSRIADFIFVPYNYLVDASMRKTILLEQRLDNAVVIFDEAHNVESSCMESSSFDLTATLLSRCIMEVEHCIVACSKDGWSPPPNVRAEPAQLASYSIGLKQCLMDLEKLIANIPITDRTLGFTREGPYIFDILGKVGILEGDHERLHQLLDNLILVCRERKDPDCGLRQLRDALSIAFRAGRASSAKQYRVHIHEESGERSARPSKGFSRSAGSRTLSFWCFSSGLIMQELMNLGVRSLILTSGTLAPLAALKNELEVEFPVVLENGHVIGEDQICVRVIPVGPSGAPLNSNYRNRTETSARELGDVLVSFSRIIPDGLLVFFPSYAAMSVLIQRWQASALIGRLEMHKRVIVEPKSSSELAGCLAAYREAIESGQGAMLFAVCRGKVSEGVDFSDRAARGVIVCGLPYAATHSDRVRLKRSYLDASAGNGSGREWYDNAAYRAVNQALGRVIRHRNDYGAILLCDQRFSGERSQGYLSLWLRHFVKVCSNFQASVATIEQFFRQCDTRPTVAPQATTGAQPKAADERFRHINPIRALAERFRQMRSNLEPVDTDSRSKAYGSPDRSRKGPSDVLELPGTVISASCQRRQMAAISSAVLQPMPMPSFDAESGNDGEERFQNPSDIPPSPLPLLANLYQKPRLAGPAPTETRKRKPEYGVPDRETMKRERGQDLLDCIKRRCAAKHYKEIKATLRTLATAEPTDAATVASNGSELSTTSNLIEKLRQLLQAIPGHQSLQLCERMAPFLPERFSQQFLACAKKPAARQFSDMIKAKSVASYEKYKALIKGLHARRSAMFTDEQRAAVLADLTELVDLLMSLDQSWPVAMQEFLTEELLELYKKCLAEAYERQEQFENLPLSERLKRNPNRNTSTSAPRNRSRMCEFCRGPPVDAHMSKLCGHQACFECWKIALATTKACQMCSRPHSRRNLEKVLY